MSEIEQGGWIFYDFLTHKEEEDFEEYEYKLHANKKRKKRHS